VVLRGKGGGVCVAHGASTHTVTLAQLRRPTHQHIEPLQIHFDGVERWEPLEMSPDVRNELWAHGDLRALPQVRNVLFADLGLLRPAPRPLGTPSARNPSTHGPRAYLVPGRPSLAGNGWRDASQRQTRIQPRV